MANNSLALSQTVTNTAKIAESMKNAWATRTRIRQTLNQTTSQDAAVRAQIDEVFLVLGHLGEAILTLGVFNKDYYLQTFGEVKSSIDSCGHELIPLAWEALDAEMQYACTAGLALCARFAPMHVYRGFGACVLGDFDWACPDINYLQEKANKKAIWTVYGIKQRVDPQPMRAVFLAFDQAINTLQVKSLAFLARPPQISGFVEPQPRYERRREKDIKHDLDLLEDWVKRLERRGHPVPPGTSMTSWGIPFATWTSQYNLSILKTERDCETLLRYQMDPGRLLHAFVCRGNIKLDSGQILLLLPGSAAESLLCWLEGLPGTTHKIVRWQDLDTINFEIKLSKALRKKIGHYPIPSQFAVRDEDAAKRPLIQATGSPTPNTISPPPYSPGGSASILNVAELHVEDATPAAVELPSMDVQEMPASPVNVGDKLVPKALSLPTSNSKKETGLTPSSSVGSASAVNRKPLAEGRPKSPGVSSTQPPSDVKAVLSEVDAIAGDTKVLHEEPKSIEPQPSDTAPVTVQPDVSLSESSKNLSNNDSTNVERTGKYEAYKPGDAESSAQPSTVANVESTGKYEAYKPEDAGASTKTNNHYLDLLNKVAKGEITPQALADMLQQGEIQSGETAARETA